MVDGCARNVRFIRAHLQRQWSYDYEARDDQHVFATNEGPLGVHDRQQFDFYRPLGGLTAPPSGYDTRVTTGGANHAAPRDVVPGPPWTR